MVRRTQPLRASALLLALLVAAPTLFGCAGEGSSAESANTEAPPEQGPDDLDRDPMEDEPEPVIEPEAAAAPDLGPHEVVLVLVHDDPLSRSETRVMDVVVERMRMRRMDAIVREATPEEDTFARPFFAGRGSDESPLPSSLAGADTVVFVRFPPQRELPSGDTATRGFGGALAFRRGEAGPFLVLRIDDEAGWRGPDEALWPWLISLVRAEAAS